MGTKKFIISLSCALCVLVVLCFVAVYFVNKSSHQTALCGTWIDSNAEDDSTIVIVFNDNNTYEKVTNTFSLTDPSVEPTTIEENGTYTIKNGKITMTPNEGDKVVLSYEYDKVKKELTIGDPAEYIKQN